MVFKSKVDIWMAIIFIFVPISMIYGVITEPSAVLLLVTAFMIVLLCILFFGTKYVIENDELIVYGEFIKSESQSNKYEAYVHQKILYRLRLCRSTGLKLPLIRIFKSFLSLQRTRSYL